MERLSDDELKAAIRQGLSKTGLSEAHFNSIIHQVSLSIREAERGKGEAGFTCPTCHGNMAQWPCEDCGSTGRIVYPKPTPRSEYADKVLEVASHIVAGTWARTGGYEIDFAIETAIKLIQAANDAAIQNAMKREGAK